MDEELPRESTVVKSSVTFPNVSEKGKRERERGGEGYEKIWSCENCGDNGFEGKMK